MSKISIINELVQRLIKYFLISGFSQPAFPRSVTHISIYYAEGNMNDTSVYQLSKANKVNRKKR